MDIAYNPIDQLQEALRRAAGHIGEDAAIFDPQVRPADPRFGDYQANGVLGYAKRTQQNPRQLAQRIVDALTTNGWLDPQQLEVDIAGPGFINFRLSAAYRLNWLQRFASTDELRSAASGNLAGRTVVIDFSSPNTAKEMHVGHIRTTVIGDCLARLLSFSGATVIRDNHIGDWGTQFGMLIWAIKQRAFDLSSVPPASAVAELEQLYKAGNEAYKSDPDTADAIRAELVKLQSGDPENNAIWKAISDVSWKSFEEIYQQLDVQFDMVLGESFYRDKLEPVYQELTTTGIACESEGALVVFHPEHKRFAKQPFIIRKADGASNYATTDLATLLYRSEELHADEVLYVVDSRQADHFEQLFLTTSKWFAASGRKVPELKHVSFGSVLGENGKPIKTKEGGSVKLKELLAESIRRCAAIVSEKNPHLPADEADHIARTIGLAAIRYADLSQNRTSDYVFAWEKMLSFDGNTAPYLLYAVARIHSIFRKAGEPEGGDYAAATPPQSDEETALARKLMAFPTALEATIGDLRPHLLCTYLFELAGDFSSFYNANKVIVDEPDVRARRLLLCHRTLVIMETGLQLLGLNTLQQM